MARTTKWMVRATLVTIGPLAVGCQAAGSEPTQLAFAQVPPTVQAAYTVHYRQAVRDVTRQSRGGTDYYTVRYTGPDGAGHDVVYNGAGDEIDRH